MPVPHASIIPRRYKTEASNLFLGTDAVRKSSYRLHGIIVDHRFEFDGTTLLKVKFHDRLPWIGF